MGLSKKEGKPVAITVEALGPSHAWDLGSFVMEVHCVTEAGA